MEDHNAGPELVYIYVHYGCSMTVDGREHELEPTSPEDKPS